jgi:hypothetical protein
MTRDPRINSRGNARSPDDGGSFDDGLYKIMGFNLIIRIAQ